MFPWILDVVLWYAVTVLAIVSCLLAALDGDYVAALAAGIVVAFCVRVALREIRP